MVCKVNALDTARKLDPDLLVFEQVAEGTREILSGLTNIFSPSRRASGSHPTLAPTKTSHLDCPSTSTELVPAGNTKPNPPVASVSEGAAQDEQAMNVEASISATCAPSASPETMSKRRRPKPKPDPGAQSPEPQEAEPVPTIDPTTISLIDEFNPKSPAPSASKDAAEGARCMEVDSQEDNAVIAGTSGSVPNDLPPPAPEPNLKSQGKAKARGKFKATPPPPSPIIPKARQLRKRKAALDTETEDEQGKGKRSSTRLQGQLGTLKASASLKEEQSVRRVLRSSRK
ncbi:hypothetical protein RSOLAG22IIIB_13432 [Rhizoctonia solani]|uniref:Uncharacterized protein n=1 Tax=Rhizoctonia solani TaxID=456999 RepID=A0A0K6FNI5_9AGAM|nr:hypothetical protein RSOLAG22IIIB_13432 [Rhizoctonia solani]